MLWTHFVQTQHPALVNVQPEALCFLLFALSGKHYCDQSTHYVLLSYHFYNVLG